MRRQLVNAGLIVTYVIVIIAVAVLHYAAIEAFWPRPAANPNRGPVAGLSLVVLLAGASAAFLRMWRRGQVVDSSQFASGPSDE